MIKGEIKLSIEEIKKRIFEAHGDQVKIIEESYFGTKIKCDFIDIDFGKWTAWVSGICKGQSHPKRSRTKSKQTCLKLYGEDNPFKVKEFKEKSIIFFQNNFGVDNVSQIQEIKDKKIATCLKNYGVANPFKSQEIREKGKQTNLEKFGVEYPTQSKIIQSKIKKTCIEKYGVDNFSKTEAFKNLNWIEIWQKSWITKKINGTSQKSFAEDQFYEFLLTIFEKDNIKRQIKINKKSIDFYIETKNLYIQFDGEYWHGLQQAIEVLKLKNNVQAIKIVKTYEADIKQNQWFKENNLKLIRITDREFKENDLIQIKKMIKNN